MKITPIRGVSGIKSPKKVQLYRAAAEKAMKGLSQNIIVSEKGEHLAKLDSYDSFERSNGRADNVSELYYSLQKDVSTIHSLEKVLDEKKQVLLEMEKLSYWSKESLRSPRQRLFDNLTKKLNENIKNEKLLTLSFYNKLDNELVKKVKAIDANKLGLVDDIYSGKIGSLNIKGTEGKPIKISIMYGEDMDKEITVDQDKNTGDIVVNMNGKRKGRYMEYRVSNEDIKLALEKLGFEVIIDKGKEKELGEIGFKELTLDEENKPLRIMTEEESKEALERIRIALKSVNVANKDLERVEVALKSILKGLEFLSQKRFDNLEDAASFIEETKENLINEEDIVFSSRFNYNRERIKNLLY